MSEKLKYAKPCLELIDFSLTSSVAGVCVMTPLQAEDTCQAMVTENGWVVYQSGNGVCIIDSFESQSFCYQVPAEDRTIHVS